jgi:hypothetical protein
VQQDANRLDRSSRTASSCHHPCTSV